MVHVYGNLPHHAGTNGSAIWEEIFGLYFHAARLADGGKAGECGAATLFHVFLHAVYTNHRIVYRVPFLVHGADPEYERLYGYVSCTPVYEFAGSVPQGYINEYGVFVVVVQLKAARVHGVAVTTLHGAKGYTLSIDLCYDAGGCFISTASHIYGNVCLAVGDYGFGGDHEFHRSPAAGACEDVIEKFGVKDAVHGFLAIVFHGYL